MGDAGGRGLGAEPHQRPLFIVMCPQSGWVLGKGADAVGLPLSLLAKAGAAVIGVLGPLHRDDADAILKQLFDIAKSPEGLAPAEGLGVEDLEEDLGVLAGHVGLVAALRRHVAEVAVAFDHLLR